MEKQKINGDMVKNEIDQIEDENISAGDVLTSGIITNCYNEISRNRKTMDHTGSARYTPKRSSVIKSKRRKRR